ncbi:MAG: pilus assembly PilX N-terminal domain-containing protein [Candidatus Omnitrophica bacterium]|nr:pilus assembly PilX N-terminal domain-containing protein [Candidatus Omnitrophota bacterium]
MNKRGVALIAAYMVIAVLTILGVGFIVRTINERNIAQRYVDSVHAFWASEAGISRALSELRINSSLSGIDLWSATLTNGSYSVDVEVDGEMLKVTSHGFAPAGVSRVERAVEAMMSKSVPSDFYDHAVYSGGDVDFNGDSYSVTGSTTDACSGDAGDVLYADQDDIEHPENISGSLTQDTTASPLARFDFQELLTISQSQGNVYDDARLQDVQQGQDSFPTSFWHTDPTDPEDPTTGVPNVVYVETDLQLNGNIGEVGGFFVVVGDVITNPDDVEDMTINGNGTIDGVIYTLGTFRINGGGGNLNINGGVWAGEEVRLNGNAQISYNCDFMSAIEALDIDAEVQIISWRDTQNPFGL